MGQLFSSQTVAKLTGASLRQLDHWARTGVLKPAGRDARGRGSARGYTFLDVVALAAVQRLRAQGCPLQKIRATVRHLRQHDPTQTDADNLVRLTVLTDGRKVYLLTDEHQVMEVVTRQHVWSLALGLLIRETQTKVAALPMEWTEEVSIGGQTYHLTVSRDQEVGGFIVQCAELPGALEQGETPEEAVANGKAAVESVLSVLKRHGGPAKGKPVKAG